MKVKVGDIVKVKPMKGCCDSTLCMWEWEWEVLAVGYANFVILREPMVMIKSGDNVRFVHESEVEKTPQ